MHRPKSCLPDVTRRLVCRGLGSIGMATLASPNAAAMACTVLATPGQAVAQTVRAPDAARVKALLQRFARLPARDAPGLQARVLAISRHFLGARFAWNPVGEGPGQFDADPTLVLDRFDCMTFVETMLALARASCANDVYDDISRLRYGHEPPTFQSRLHFVSVDWWPMARRLGVLGDALPPAGTRPGIHELPVRVEKRQWLTQLAENDMYQALIAAAAPAARQHLQDWGQTLQPAEASLTYVDAATLTAEVNGAMGSAHVPLLQPGMVVAVLRPGAPFNRAAGGQDPVTHLGIAVDQQGRWLLRSTSQPRRRVMDLPLRAVLQQVKGHAPVLGCLLWTALPRPVA